jgi:hypothetical protein
MEQARSERWMGRGCLYADFISETNERISTRLDTGGLHKEVGVWIEFWFMYDRYKPYFAI